MWTNREWLVSVVLMLASQGLAAERHVPGGYATIQAAIDAASDGDEVIIEPNTYTGDGNRDLDFGGKAITVRSTDPDDPNVVAATVIKCNPDDPNDPDDPNYYGGHRGFYFHTAEDPNSIVAGLTITNGYTSAEDPNDPNGWGGGMYCDVASPTVTNCTFIGNTAIYYGGGMFNYQTSSPVVRNCTFSQNGGGGMFNWGSSSPTVTQCIFNGNTAFGGMCNWENSSPTVTQCTFNGNAALSGGGMFNLENSSPTVTNCTFTGNTAIYYGGGMCNYQTSSPAVTNCTFSGNGGGGMCNWQNSSPNVTNCILWSNTPDEIYDDSDSNSTSLVTYTCIEGGWTGTGNIGDAPCFVDPNGPDGNPNTWDDNDYHLSPNSPCIDAGDPNGVYIGQTDMDGQGRVYGIVDMGTDEIWPSSSYTLTLTVKGGEKGVITMDPDELLDPNDDPNDPEALRQYAAGTVVTLRAIPNEGRSFKYWKIYDPNYPGDTSHKVKDSNNPITILMDADREVRGVYNCGSGADPILPMILGVLGVFALTRRSGHPG